jgi:hypothetical protein
MAPTGIGRLPIGQFIPEEPVGIVDEDGNVLADEVGNELIFG